MLITVPNDHIRRDVKQNEINLLQHKIRYLQHYTFSFLFTK